MDIRSEVLQGKTPTEMAKSLKLDIKMSYPFPDFNAIFMRMVVLAYDDKMATLLVEADAFIANCFDFSGENSIEHKAFLRLPAWALKLVGNIVLACRAIYNEAIQRGKKELSASALLASKSHKQSHQKIARNFFLNVRAKKIRAYRQSEEEIDQSGKHQVLQNLINENLSKYKKMIAKIDSQCKELNSIMGDSFFPSEFFSKSTTLVSVLEDLYEDQRNLSSIRDQFSFFYEITLIFDFNCSLMRDEATLKERIEKKELLLFDEEDKKSEEVWQGIISFCRFFGLLELTAKEARASIRKIMMAYERWGAQFSENSPKLFVYFLRLNNFPAIESKEEKLKLLAVIEGKVAREKEACQKEDSDTFKRMSDFINIVQLYTQDERDQCIEALFALIEQAKPEDQDLLPVINHACGSLLMDGYAGQKGKEKALAFFATDKNFMIHEVYLLMKILAYQNREVRENIRNCMQDAMQFARRFLINVFPTDYPNLFFNDDILNRVRNRHAKESSEQAIKDLTANLLRLEELLPPYRKGYVQALDIIKQSTEVKCTQTMNSSTLFSERRVNTKTMLAEPSQTIERQQPGM